MANGSRTGKEGKVPDEVPAQKLTERIAELEGRLGPLSNQVAQAAESAKAQIGELAKQVERDRLSQLVDERLGCLLEQLEGRLEAREQRHKKRVDQILDTFDEESDRYLALVRSIPAGGVEGLRQDRDALQAELEEAQRALISLRQETLEREAEVHELTTRDGRVRLEAARAAQREVEKARSELSALEQLQTENARLEAELEKYRAVERQEAVVFRQEAELEDAVQRVDELGAANGQLRNELRRARGAKAQLLREVDSLSKENRGYRDKLKALEDEHALLLEKAYRLPELEAQLAEWPRRWSETDDARKSLELSVAEANEARAAAQKAHQEAERRANDAEAMARATMETEFKIRLATARDEMRAEVDNRVDAQVARFTRAHEELQGEVRRLEAEREAWQAERAVHLDQIAHLEARESERGRAWQAEREQRVRDHEAALAQAREAELGEVAEEVAKLTVQETSLAARAVQLSDQVNTQEQQLQTLRREIADEAARHGTLRTQIEDLEERQRQLRHVDLPRKQRLADVVRPEVEAMPLSPKEFAEDTWLEDIAGKIKQAGFVFPPRILRAFHTSLKCADISPLTVLAGISGTGKSELPRLYADCGGLQFLNFAVQPSWDSPEDLFGFFDQTTGRYSSTPLTRALYQVNHPESEHPLGDRLLLVLLDEMNLARVEHYFSELLSKLEVRRGLRRGSDEARRASIRVDSGSGHADELLFLDHNVLFVGTMNEDESTLSLTDKVKDRASIISFPRPEVLLGQKVSRVPPVGEALPRTRWEAWCQAERLMEDDREVLGECAAGFNRALDEVGRAIGHRVFQAIHRYAALYPRRALGSRGFEDALSDIYAQKLLPKLVGVECRSAHGAACLDQVAAKLPAELKPAFDRARQDDYFAWSGSRELFRAANTPG